MGKINTFKSINPFDQSVIAEYPLLHDREIDAVLQNSANAFDTWKNIHPDHRSELLIKVAALLREKKEALAKTISLEMGKIINESRSEIEKCAWNCAYYAEHGAHMTEPEIIQTDAFKSYIVFEPVGAIFAIMPWNFPFWQVFRFAAPALMAGNTIILKHAPNVCGCALEIENIFREAGFPDHVFQTVIIDIDAVEKIIAHDAVQGVTLTGSEQAGSAVAALAGKYIKKSVLELGGSDPMIILNDANIRHAAKIAMLSRFQNAGQSCIAGKRFIVEKGVKDAFVQTLMESIRNLKQGDQLKEGITIGPMARIDLAEKLAMQQYNSVQKGAVVVFGGNRNDANYAPALLTAVQPGMPAFDEELFGPVAAVIEAENAMHAIELANKSRFGLGAALFSEDLKKAQLLAGKIQAGNVFINAMVKSDPRLPFGGTKKSGYGRELSQYGMKEFMHVKTVFMQEA